MENDHATLKTCAACGSTASIFFLRKDGCDLYHCTHCGHGFMYPLPADTAGIYGEDYFAGATQGAGYVEYDTDKEPMRPVFVDYLRRIETYTGKKGRLLDIGAATGFFVGIATGCGWEAEGLEISRFAAEEATQKGHKVTCGTLKDSQGDVGAFTVVTMWDVLEHITDPDTEIRAVYNLLEVGGVVAINTPDMGSWYARVMGKRWHLLVPPEHVHYFTTTGIKIFLERNGFRVELTSKIGKTFTLEYVVHILATWLKSSVLRRLASYLKGHPRIGGLSMPINLRDNMFVIARKI